MQVQTLNILLFFILPCSSPFSALPWYSEPQWIRRYPRDDTITPPTTSPPTLPSTWPWSSNWLLQNGYRLGDPDAENAFPVYVERDGSHYAVCDDLWNDIAAIAMCKMRGMRHGRRTSVTAKLDFASTNVDCYSQTETVLISDKTRFVMARASYCSDQVYEEGEVLPCARTQGAAVYCWIEPWSVDFYNVQVLAREEEYFTMQFNVRYVKYGQYLAENDTSLVNKPAFNVDQLTSDRDYRRTHFHAQCWDTDALKVTRISLALRDMGSFYLLEGLDTYCGNCFDVMYVREDKPVQRICPYSMSQSVTRVDLSDNAVPQTMQLFDTFDL